MYLHFCAFLLVDFWFYSVEHVTFLTNESSIINIDLHKNRGRHFGCSDGSNVSR